MNRILFILSLLMNSCFGQISFHAATGSNNAGGGTTIVMTMPTVSNGDILIMDISVVGGTGSQLITATGWTLLNHYSGSVLQHDILWRIASSEPASYTVTIVASKKASGTITSLSNASSTQPVAAQMSFQSNASSATLTAATLGTFASSNGIDLFLGGAVIGTTVLTVPTNYTAGAESASTGTTSNVAYRALSAVTTVGSLTETYNAAALNIVNHLFIIEAAGHLRRITIIN